MSTTLDALAASTAGSGAAAAASTRNDAGSADRFLKLLVAQMQSQDPLNPMDNAQITSQMAQINTVNGISQLNATVEGLSSQFVQMQTLQGAALVGRDVTVKGDRLAVAGGEGVGAFELDASADRVKVEILAPAGQVVATLDVGAQGAGVHAFRWAAPELPDGAPYRFRIVAHAGTLAVPSTPLMRDRVEAVSTVGDKLMLETRDSGSVAYRDVRAFN